MKIITVSRQFSSGGRELAKRLADALDFDYYDKEIISEIAKNKGLDADFVESSLSLGSYRAIPLHFAKSFSFTFSNTGMSELMAEEKRVIEKIVQKGRDFVIVGRNADILLKEYCPLNIFVCADLEHKINRCIEKSSDNEALTRREIIKQMKQIDKNRSTSRSLLSSTPWGECTNYHLTLNTSGYSIKELVPVAVSMSKIFFGE